MKISKFLITGMTTIAISGCLVTTSLTTVASAKTTTYQFKNNTIHYYSKLPNHAGIFKHTKKTTGYGLKSVHVKVTEVKTVHHVKYAKVGHRWVKFSQLKKLKALKHKKHTSGQSANSANNNDDTDANNDDNANDNNSNSDSSSINWNDPNSTQQAVQAAFDYLNQARTQAGLPALQLNSKLAQVANLRASQLVSNFSHYDASGNLAFQSTAQQLGYNGNQSPFGTWGENIAQGYVGDNDTIQTVGQQGIKMFQDEGPENGDGKVHGHYENDMSKEFNQVGIGFKYDPASQNTYLAVDFGVGDSSNSSSTTPSTSTSNSTTTPTNPSNNTSSGSGIKINHNVTVNTGSSSNSNAVTGSSSSKTNANTSSAASSGTSTSSSSNGANNSSNTTQINNMNNYSPFNNNSSTSSSIDLTTDSNRQAAAQAAFNALNQYRTNAGLPALSWNDKLAKVAVMRSNELISNFSHYNSANHLAAKDDAAQLGYSWGQAPFGTWGENIAQGYSDGSIQDAGKQGIDMFQSEGPENGDGKVHGHYVNDMSTSFNAVGIGFSYDPNSGNTYLAVNFGYNG